jgi:hypothetical protein
MAATVTADDLVVLARAEDPQAVLAYVDGEIVVAHPDEVGGGKVLLTKEGLTHELGDEITEYEAVILAGRLTADLAESERPA